MAELRPTPAQREAVRRRAGGCCEYGRSREDHCCDVFSIEHVFPAARGGTNHLANLALSCQKCNNHKYTHTEALDPVTGAIAPLFNPRMSNWADHFNWVDDSATMIGLTPTGRATIHLLRLNRVAVVNLRKVLRAAGKHPPELTASEETKPND